MTTEAREKYKGDTGNQIRRGQLPKPEISNDTQPEPLSRAFVLIGVLVVLIAGGSLLINSGSRWRRRLFVHEVSFFNVHCLETCQVPASSLVPRVG